MQEKMEDNLTRPPFQKCINASRVTLDNIIRCNESYLSFENWYLSNFWLIPQRMYFPRKENP